MKADDDTEQDRMERQNTLYVLRERQCIVSVLLRNDGAEHVEMRLLKDDVKASLQLAMTS